MCCPAISHNKFSKRANILHTKLASSITGFLGLTLVVPAAWLGLGRGGFACRSIPVQFRDSCYSTSCPPQCSLRASSCFHSLLQVSTCPQRMLNKARAATNGGERDWDPAIAIPTLIGSLLSLFATTAVIICWTFAGQNRKRREFRYALILNLTVAGILTA